MDTVNSTTSTVRSEVHNGYEAPAPKTNPAMYPTSTVRSQVHNGYEASSTKANPASYPTVVPEKSSQFEPIDEKGSSFGRFFELCYVMSSHFHFKLFPC